MSRAPVVLALALAAPAVAAVPVSVTQQGRLLDDLGEPLSGQVTLSFTLYDADDAAVWSSGDLDVELGSSGHYAVVLGTADNPLDADVLQGGATWLGLSVDGAPELDRVPLSAVPYAAVAGVAERVAPGSIDADALAEGAVTDDAVGSLSWSKLSDVPDACADGEVLAGADGAWVCADVRRTIVATAPLRVDEDEVLSLDRADALTDGYLAADDFARFESRVADVLPGAGVEVTGDSSAPTVGVVFGSEPGTVTEGDDPRLSDPRPPTPGSPHYVHNGPDAPQDASIALTGDATVGGTVSAGAYEGLTWDAIDGRPPTCADGQALVGLDGVWTCADVVTGVTAEGPLVVEGDPTAPVVRMARADAVTDGFLAAEDFSRFGAKVGSVSGGDGVTVSGDPTAPTVGLVYGDGPGTVTEGDDPRLSDPRAPTAGSPHYVQNRSGDPQDASLAITGDATVGGTVSAGAYDGLSWADVDGRPPTCEAGQVLSGTGGAWTCIDVVTSIGATGPLASSGGRTPGLSIDRADATVDGFLAADDFARFAGKVDRVTAGDGVEIGGTSGAPSVGVVFGTGSGTVAAGDDPRFSDARAPTPGSDDYIQNRSGSPQSASIAITGDAFVGGTVSAGAYEGLSWADVDGRPPTCPDGQVLTGADGGFTCTDNVQAVTASGPLQVTGGTTRALSMTRAGRTTNGYLAAADFARFDDKVASVSAGDGLTVVGDAELPTVGVVFGSAAGTVTEGDDPRLSDRRDPLPGSPDYLQNQPDTPQDASLAITGDATVGGGATFGGDVTVSGTVHARAIYAYTGVFDESARLNTYPTGVSFQTGSGSGGCGQGIVQTMYFSSCRARQVCWNSGGSVYTRYLADHCAHTGPWGAWTRVGP